MADIDADFLREALEHRDREFTEAMPVAYPQRKRFAVWVVAGCVFPVAAVVAAAYGGDVGLYTAVAVIVSGCLTVRRSLK